MSHLPVRPRSRPSVQTNRTPNPQPPVHGESIPAPRALAAKLCRAKQHHGLGVGVAAVQGPGTAGHPSHAATRGAWNGPWLFPICPRSRLHCDDCDRPPIVVGTRTKRERERERRGVGDAGLTGVVVSCPQTLTAGWDGSRIVEWQLLSMYMVYMYTSRQR